GLAKNVIGQWLRAESTNHWLHIQEFFETNGVAGRLNKSTINFDNDLTDAIGRDPSVYYRLIAQLGTDTGVSDFTNKINLNYANLGTNYATNLVSWDLDQNTAVTFFTNVAERLFRAQFNDFNPF